MKYEFYNPNPKVRYHRDGTPFEWHRGDCTTRALAKALDLSWEDAFKLQCEEALKQFRKCTSIEVIQAILLAKGFTKIKVSQEYIKRHHKRPTIRQIIDQFQRVYPDTKYKLIHNTTRHIVASEGDTLYDVWDSGNQPELSLWCKKAA